MTLGKPNLVVFAETLEAIAANDKNVLAVTSDSRGSGKLVNYGKVFPDQIIEVGIAEQNLVGLSAGLASTGKKVFAVSPACFLTARSLEQIKNDVCYSDNPVNLIGISAGVSYGALGSTHHSIHDIAVLRAVNNINIVVPADNFESQEIIKLAANTNEPFFIKFGKSAMHNLEETPTEFALGKGRVIRNGTHLVFIATGETVFHAFLAAGRLAKSGIECKVISMHSIKPFDKALLLKSAEECGAVITVEEHSIYGGLGELCASILMQENCNVAFRIVGLPDEYTVTGSQKEIFDHYGISEEGLANSAMELLKQKR